MRRVTTLAPQKYIKKLYSKGSTRTFEVQFFLFGNILFLLTLLFSYFILYQTI